MSQSEATKTLVDAQRDHKELQAKMTVLKGNIEIAEKKHAKILSNTESLREESRKIGEELQEARDHTFKVLQEGKDFLQRMFSFLAKADIISEGSLNFIQKLQAKMDEWLEKIAGAKKEYEEFHTRMVEEEHLLALKKRDLDIYENRLNEKIEKAGLQNEIRVIL